MMSVFWFIQHSFTVPSMLAMIPCGDVQPTSVAPMFLLPVDQFNLRLFLMLFLHFIVLRHVLHQDHYSFKLGRFFFCIIMWVFVFVVDHSSSRSSSTESLNSRSSSTYQSSTSINAHHPYHHHHHQPKSPSPASTTTQPSCTSLHNFPPVVSSLACTLFHFYHLCFSL